MRYVILGGGVTGMSAARTLREHDPNAEITVYTQEVHPFGFYARKNLIRQFAAGAVDAHSFLIETAESLEQQGIQFLYEEVLRVFPQLHQVLQVRHIRRTYDRLLVASGTSPRIVNVPGIQTVGVHQLSSYEDLAYIEAWMPELQQQGAAVIGGGILGLDMAFALAQRDVPTTLVVRGDRLGLPRLSEATAQTVYQQLRRMGVDIILNDTVEAFVSHDDRILDHVRLATGRMIPARMALCAVGVEPATDFLEGSGLAMDTHNGAVQINPTMQTNLEHVFAAGSCAVLNGQSTWNWEQAAEQGRIAALNMLGENQVWQPAPEVEPKPLILEEAAFVQLV